MATGKFASPSAYIAIILLGDRSKAGVKRVVRGGSWNNNGRNCRSACRNRNEPDNRNNNVGFRLLLAQYTVGTGVNDQIVIQFCRQPQAKSKVSGALVMGWMPRERPSYDRFNLSKE